MQGLSSSEQLHALLLVLVHAEWGPESEAMLLSSVLSALKTFTNLQGDRTDQTVILVQIGTRGLSLVKYFCKHLKENF